MTESTVSGFSGEVALSAQLVYGVGGLLDVIATVLALWAVQARFGSPQVGER